MGRSLWASCRDEPNTHFRQLPVKVFHSSGKRDNGYMPDEERQQPKRPPEPTKPLKEEWLEKREGDPDLRKSGGNER